MTSRDRRLLADFVLMLKDRDGRSYQSLSRRLRISGSTLHRYGTASSVPREFSTLHSFAVTCGARAEEVHELHRLWAAAVNYPGRSGRKGWSAAVPIPPPGER